MTEARPQKGHCLCGAVTFTATPVALEMGVCHCGMCRRWSGGVMMVVMCGQSVQIHNEAELGVFASSEFGERCFCKKCGTSLFWRMRGKTSYEVAAQAFEDPSVFEFTEQIFIDMKPGNYEFANETRKLTGEEFKANVAAQLAHADEDED